MSARFKRWVVSATACMLTLSQVMMPVQAAYASGGNNSSERGGSSSNSSGDPKKVYVCKYIGTPGVNERAQTGQNPIEVSVNAVDGAEVGDYFNDQQGRSYVLGTVPMTPEPSVTDCPNVVDVEDISVDQVVVCGPNNDVLTAQAVANVTFTMSDWINNMRTVTATLDAGYSWSDGTDGLVKTYSFTDANTECDEPTPISVPEVMANDPCGLNNATWIVPSSEGQPYTFSLTEDGELVVTANEGYVFIEYGASFSYGQAQDSSVLCPTIAECEVIEGPILVSTKEQFADYDESRSSGNYEFTSEGVRIYTTDNSSQAKVAWYNYESYALSEIGVPSMEYTATPADGTKPGLQIVIDFDNDGTTDGILVGESIYGDDWWLTNGSKQFVKDGAPSHSGGFGSENHGTLNQWLTSFPEAHVQAVGFSLGSGILADGVLKSLTFGCKQWVFMAERISAPCTVSSATYQQPWVYDETTFPEAGAGGLFNFEPTGLYLSTPDVESYVYGLFNGGNTPIADVDVMSYKTLRLAQSAGYQGTQPAYILLVDTNGADTAGGERYFFYEPYNNDSAAAETEGVWQTWDAIDGGNATWYISGTGQALRSWSSLVNEFPDAVVLSFGFNQGSSNAETFSAVQDIVFDCATVSFNNTQTGGSGGSGGETPTTPTAPTTPTPVTPAAAVGELPAELPYTGAPQNMTGIYGLLIALITYAAVYFGQPRKRLDFND